MQATRLIQTVAVVVALGATALVHAAPQKVEQLPRVVITGKSVQASQQVAVVKLPRVVIEGRSLGAIAQGTQLAAAKPTRRI